MREIKAVILDIDGTLLLSNDAHARAFVDAAAELGIEADYEKIRRLIGKGGDKLIPEVFGFEKDSSAGKELDGRKGEIFRDAYLPHLAATPGARALLERMTERGLRLVVATSADRDDLQLLLEQAGVSDLIEASTSAGDVEESKPAPDVVTAALAQTEFGPDAVVMIGDTPYDVEAAGRAGVAIIAVRCGGWSDHELRGSLAVYDDPEDILANFAASPLATA